MDRGMTRSCVLLIAPAAPARQAVVAALWGGGAYEEGEVGGRWWVFYLNSCRLPATWGHRLPKADKTFWRQTTNVINTQQRRKTRPLNRHFGGRFEPFPPTAVARSPHGGTPRGFSHGAGLAGDGSGPAASTTDLDRTPASGHVLPRHVLPRHVRPEREIRHTAEPRWMEVLRT